MNEVDKNSQIKEILKKSSGSNNEPEKSSDNALKTVDTIAVAKDKKAILARQISPFKSLKNIDVQYIGYVAKHIIRKRRLFSFSRLIFLFVLFPTFLVFFYLCFWASPMYISNMKFSVQNANSNLKSLDFTSLLTAGGTSNRENYIVLEYLQSLDLIKEVNKDLDITRHYSSHDYDIISRLTSNPTNNELEKYWEFAVASNLDTESGIINVDVKAYTPEMAKKISEVLLNKSEDLVNDLNERLQLDTINLAEKELKIALDKVEKQQLAMKNFREAHATFDPELAATGMQSRIEALQAEHTRLQTELNRALSIMNKNAPQVKNLKKSIEAVEKQLVVENKKVTGNDNVTLTSVMAEYEALVTDLKFAQEQQVTAMRAVEAARVQHLTQSSYLVCVQEPTFPDESLYPRVYLFTFYTFCGALLCLALVSLVVAAVREHTGF